MSGSGVLCAVRPWVESTDYWPTYSDLNREAQIRLSETGIRIATLRHDLEARDTPRAD